MRSKKLRFQGGQGNLLSAQLDLPVDGHPIAYALFAHCFTCTKNLKTVAHISRALTRERIAVLRFDFTGLGESEGDFADTNFSSNVADLLAAATFLETEHNAPRILIGHSLGGAAVLQAASKIPSCRAVATIGAPANPLHVKRLLSDQAEEITRKGEAMVTLEGRDFKIKKQFLDDLEHTRMEAAISNLRKALLIFHSPLDNIVGIENAARIFQTARHPKSFISLDRADHLLMDSADARYVGTVTAAWALKYMGMPEDNSPARKASEDQQVTARIGSSGFRTEIMANGLSLVADEPVKVGGTNTGPTPYDYLNAALGACTAMTLRMYADRKKWPLEEVVVHLSHDKVHVKDCHECESKDGWIDRIQREVILAGDLDAAQQKRLLEIADRCPVHRTLNAEVMIETRLKS
jgi:uncharacterized OsmC-like protein/alpha/beta superfamily hydrolase